MANSKSRDKVIYTTAYSGKNKNGVYPSHVLDIISEGAADLLDYYTMQKKYGDILQPNGALQYWVDWNTVGEFKKTNVATGRRRYKAAMVP